MRFMQTAAAAAIASAFFCGSAFAETPTVTLYGIVNTGLSYTHQKTAPVSPLTRFRWIVATTSGAALV